MHGPAEHTIEGVRHDLEMHIVHEMDGLLDEFEMYRHNLAVVGVIFKKSEVSHPFVTKLKSEDLGHIESINFSELFNCLKGTKDSNGQIIKKLDFYHY
jgi:carbonic anhydrase